MALVITRSRTFGAEMPAICPMPSRRTFPPPNLHSSPYTVKSRSMTIDSDVSPRRTLSPTVGPYIEAYTCLGIFTTFSSGSDFRRLTCSPRPSSSSCAKFPSCTRCMMVCLASSEKMFAIPAHKLLPPLTIWLPAMVHRDTSFVSPGSNRTAVPCRKKYVYI
eukprot:scaffold1896_cov262-Pinguiococcus_pyrenoidosus.AAC.5